jgi:N6-adenosine-specific RNA methylase IME4
MTAAAQVDLLGRYGVITADPPWSYDDSAARAGVDHHYKTLSIAQLITMPVHELAADNAVLFMWITNAHVIEGVGARIARAWGFQPKTLLTWDKQKMGVGKTFRGRTEHVLFAMRGRPTFPHHNLTTLLDRLPTYPAEGAMMDLPARSQVHSEKPSEFFSLVEHACPVGPYLELFGRGAPRANWHKWGNEAEGGVSLPGIEKAIAA